MAPVTKATPQTAPRRRGRPRKYPLPPDSEPPLKKQKYNGSASSRNALFGSANASLTVSRLRPSRRHSDMGRGASRQHPSTPFPRIHNDDTKLPYGSSAAAASAISQSDTYKPREERSWEDYHPDLDIDMTLPVYRAEDVDGPRTPSQNGQLGGSPVLGQALQMLQQQNGSPTAGGAGMILTPIKRRPGRPPKRPEAMMYGLGSPQQRIIPAPLQNPKERLVLPKPNFRRIETFASYERSPGVGINFVEKTFANVGYQESDIFPQPRTLIRGGKSSLEDENESNTSKDDILDTTSAIPGAGNIPHPKVRVEYDMDEQDERWLEVINAERTASGVDIIRPQYFEIAMTLIEKEWHALEKSKFKHAERLLKMRNVNEDDRNSKTKS
jgi:NuA3 HAT complex component NTO1